jgi:beta-glucosidase
MPSSMPSFPIDRFPEDFDWGCATSSFQIEGGGSLDGRLPCIWDDFCAQPGRIRDGSNGAIACDHYHRYAEDIRLIAELGFRHYRFSIAWPRVVTADNRLNDAGLDFYKRLLDELDRYQITPNATLFHWDLPSHLEGGWLQRDTAYRLADYAQMVAQRLGDRLPRVATLNEPWTSAFLGYDVGNFAPGVQSREAAMSAAHHHMLAHGLAVQAWRAEHADTALGIVLNPELCDPETANPADEQAARLAEYERNECFLNPIFGREWPAELLAQAGSRLSDRRSGDLEICAQPIDFIGLNYYTRSIARAPVTPADRQRGYTYVPPVADGTRRLTDIGWEIYPQGLSRIVRKLSDTWPLPPIWITENGAADNTPVVNGACSDTLRCAYLQSHLAQVADCIAQGIDIRGYYVWSLLDNFEWAQGYSQRFGIVHVDFETQERTCKKSALMFQAGLRK